MELVVDKMMKKKVSIIPLTLSIVIAAAWTLRWAIESRDVSLGEILAIERNNIKPEEITAFRLATTTYLGHIGSGVTINPGDPEFEEYLEVWPKTRYKIIKRDSKDNPVRDLEHPSLVTGHFRIQVDAIVDGKRTGCIISIFPDAQKRIFWFDADRYVYQYPEDCELLNPDYITQLIDEKSQ